MSAYNLALIAAGALATIGIGTVSHSARAPALVAGLSAEAGAARDGAGGAGIALSFVTSEGWRTRHVTLQGGDALSESARARVAEAIAAVRGIGGVQWAGAARAGEKPAPLHCQQDVAAILQARSIRFAEASAIIDPTSNRVLDEVATALRPCVGGIIAITGHTNVGGEPEANRALSRARAEAVRWALVGRGIPANGLRAAGKGSEVPIKGLDPADAANRRIEFSVIETVPIDPTPIDTPGPG